jgi:hypothetical protein
VSWGAGRRAGGRGCRPDWWVTATPRSVRSVGCRCSSAIVCADSDDEIVVLARLKQRQYLLPVACDQTPARNVWVRSRT